MRRRTAAMCLALLVMMTAQTYAASNDKSDQWPSYCNSGPGTLRFIDTWERENKNHPTVTLNDQKLKPEAAAEILIADCSGDVARVSGMATGMDNPYLDGMVAMWKENLEFMKWWLKNRHQKQGCPPHQ